MGYRGLDAPHPRRRSLNRYVFLSLLLVALAAPAGMVLAGESTQAYVVLFRDDAVTVPAQAVEAGFLGGADTADSTERAIDERLVFSHVRELSALTGMRGVTDIYANAVGGFSARLTPSQLRRVSADAAVSAVLPDYAVSLGPEIAGEAAGGVRSTANPAERVPAGVRRVGARNARVTGLTARGRNIDADVAILDTGVQRDHPDLNVAGGYNCTGRNRDRWDDTNGHGTHVAGIVGAYDNRFGVTGVAPGARLWSVKVLDSKGSGFVSWVVCGVDWVAAQRDRGGRPLIEVANMSLTFHLPGGNDAGCGESSRDSLHLAICRSVQRGTVFVAAAGNSSRNARGERPAAYDQVITVSAMADYDGRGGGHGKPSDSCPYWTSDPDDGFASFSNYGPDIDLIAPGRCIVSTYLRGRYAWMSGTSMATPHVAGAAAIYRSMYPRANPDQVRMALQAVGKLDWRTGTDPDKTHEKSLWIGQFRAAPDFAISASFRSAVAPPGGGQPLDVAISRVGGFDRPISITLAEAPRGIRATATTARGGAATLRVEVASGVRPGRYSVTVVAEAAGVVRSATVSLIVSGSVTRSAFSAPRDGLTVTAGTSLDIAWSSAGGQGGARLVRQSARIRTAGTCAGARYTTDYARSNARPLTERLRDGRCYRWRLMVGGNVMQSGEVLVDTTAPRPPAVTLTADVARVNVDGIGVKAAYVGDPGTLWVRASSRGSVRVNVEALDRESGIARNVAELARRGGWRASWIGDSADGALRLDYATGAADATLRIWSVNGAGLASAVTMRALRRDARVPSAVHWTTAPSGSTQRIKVRSFRLDWAGGRDDGSGLATRHIVARYVAGLTSGGDCRRMGFSRDGGFRLASDRALETGLEPSRCYVWSVRTLDNVGNYASSVVSGYVITGPRR